MKRAQRFKRGSVVLDRRRKTWNFLAWEDGKRRTRRIGTLGQYPTKSAAQWAAHAQQPTAEVPKPSPSTPTVNTLIERYRRERMPTRLDTRRSYEVYLSNHIVPKWGTTVITDLAPRPVELWLEALPLAPKSKAHVRSLLRNLWDFAAWSGEIPAEHRNPLALVRIKGSSTRTHAPRVLTIDEFQQFSRHLSEPFRTLAALCFCMGLRISECLALQWRDVEWAKGLLNVERGIVAGHLGETKTAASRKRLVIDGELLTALRNWKARTQFSGNGDWIFASPVQHGRKPWSYHHVRWTYGRAAKAAGMEPIATHTARHTFRSWLDSVGTPIGVQQRLMRHSDVRTTMSVYGDALPADLVQAHGKIVSLALNGLPADCKPN
jgi:integrase